MNNIQVVCNACGTINRVPQERLHETPGCGRCRSPLFTGHSATLTGGNFETVLRRNSLPVLVLFWAGWCGYCQRMRPQFEAVARRLEPDFRLGQLNTEANPQLASRYAVQSLPTLILFKGGQEVIREAGALDGDQIVAWAQRHR